MLKSMDKVSVSVFRRAEQEHVCLGPPCAGGAAGTRSYKGTHQRPALHQAHEEGWAAGELFLRQLFPELCRPQQSQRHTPWKTEPGEGCYLRIFPVILQITERHFYVSSQQYSRKCSQVCCNKINSFDTRVNKINLSTAQCHHPGVSFSGLISQSFRSLAVLK